MRRARERAVAFGSRGDATHAGDVPAHVSACESISAGGYRSAVVPRGGTLRVRNTGTLEAMLAPVVGSTPYSTACAKTRSRERRDRCGAPERRSNAPRRSP